MNPQVNKINEDIESLRFLIKETQKRISLLEEDLKSKYNIEPYKRDINADIKRIDSVLIKNYNITFNEVIAKNRKTYVVLKRHIIAYFLSVDRGYELKQIGSKMLNRDHSTIINSKKKLLTYLAKDMVNLNIKTSTTKLLMNLAKIKIK